MPKSGSAFGLGLTAGMMIGALGVYLFATEEGKKTRLSWEKEWSQAKRNNLPTVNQLEIPLAELWSQAKEKLEIWQKSLSGSEAIKKNRRITSPKQIGKSTVKTRRFKGT